MPRTGSPLTYGDDGYIYAIYGAAGGTLVRGTLGGGTESIPMPTGANRISINGNGDVVAYNRKNRGLHVWEQASRHGNSRVRSRTRLAIRASMGPATS